MAGQDAKFGVYPTFCRSSPPRLLTPASALPPLRVSADLSVLIDRRPLVVPIAVDVIAVGR
jgi:hypothetical protein